MKLLDEKDCVVAFGEFVRKGRDKKGLYQAEVAEMLGISQGYYSHIELGNREVPLTLALKICSVLGLDLNDFVALFNKKTPSL